MFIVLSSTCLFQFPPCGQVRDYLASYFTELYVIMIIIIMNNRAEAVHLYLPSNIEEAKQLGRVLSKYTNTHYYVVLGAVVVTYILYPIYIMIIHD